MKSLRWKVWQFRAALRFYKMFLQEHMLDEIVLTI